MKFAGDARRYFCNRATQKGNYFQQNRIKFRILAELNCQPDVSPAEPVESLKRGQYVHNFRDISSRMEDTRLWLVITRKENGSGRRGEGRRKDGTERKRDPAVSIPSYQLRRVDLCRSLSRKVPCLFSIASDDSGDSLGSTSQRAGEGKEYSRILFPSQKLNILIERENKVKSIFIIFF